MKNKYKVLIIFTIFLSFLLFQIHYVGLYYDDYGYASLTYLKGTTWQKGMSAGITDVIKFLIYHYNNWGGRVLWFFLEIILLKLSTTAFKIVQVIFTTLIYYLIYKIISKITKIDNWKLALGTILCFGLVDLMVLRESYYWATASVLYILPFLPILLVIYLTIDKRRNLFINILCILLAIIGAWSQEQISIFFVSYLGLMTIYRFFIEKEKNKWDIFITISAIIGFIILMMSPGSKERMTETSYFYNLDLIHKILRNIPLIIKENFCENTRLFSILFFSTSLYLMFTNIKKFKYKIIINIGIINQILILLVTLIKEVGYFKYAYFFDINPNIITIIITIQLLYTLLIIGLCLYKEKQIILTEIFIGSILSQVAMIMAPYFPIRSVIIFEMSYYLIIIYILSKLLENKKINIYLILIPIAIISFDNYRSITEGYKLNYPIRCKNEEKLKEASKKIKKGEKIDEILLDPYNVYYGINDPKEVYKFLKGYFDIPKNVKIKYNWDN